jgi:hypothetical protein
MSMSKNSLVTFNIVECAVERAAERVAEHTVERISEMRLDEVVSPLAETPRHRLAVLSKHLQPTNNVDELMQCVECTEGTGGSAGTEGSQDNDDMKAMSTKFFVDALGAFQQLVYDTVIPGVSRGDMADMMKSSLRESVRAIPYPTQISRIAVPDSQIPRFSCGPEADAFEFYDENRSLARFLLPRMAAIGDRYVRASSATNFDDAQLTAIALARVQSVDEVQLYYVVGRVDQDPENVYRVMQWCLSFRCAAQPPLAPRVTRLFGFDASRSMEVKIIGETVIISTPSLLTLFELLIDVL